VLQAAEEQVKERVTIVNREQRSHAWPDFVHALETTALSVEETLIQINALPGSLA
jgi:hypothetical protein